MVSEGAIMQIALQLVGLTVISVGCFMVAVWLGLIISGLAILAIGTGYERSGNE